MNNCITRACADLADDEDERLRHTRLCKPCRRRCYRIGLKRHIYQASQQILGAHAMEMRAAEAQRAQTGLRLWG